MDDFFEELPEGILITGAKGKCWYCDNEAIYGALYTEVEIKGDPRIYPVCAKHLIEYFLPKLK